MTAHTLRHTFGSIAGELGYSELTIAAMLGHAAGSVTGRYVHIDEAVRSATERVSAEIAGLLDAQAGPAAATTAQFYAFRSVMMFGTPQATGSLVTVRKAG